MSSPSDEQHDVMVVVRVDLAAALRDELRTRLPTWGAGLEFPKSLRTVGEAPGVVSYLAASGPFPKAQHPELHAAIDAVTAAGRTSIDWIGPLADAPRVDAIDGAGLMAMYHVADVSADGLGHLTADGIMADLGVTCSHDGLDFGIGLDPIALASLVLDVDATTLALADEAPVASWADQSGNSNDVLQATASFQPTFEADINGSGYVGVESDSSNDFLELPAAVEFDPANPFHFFIVATRLETASGGIIAWTNGGTAYQMLAVSTDKLNANIGGTASGNSAAAAWPIGTRAILEVVNVTGALGASILVDGVSVLNWTPGVAKPAVAGDAKLFATGTDAAPTFPSRHGLHRVLAYDAVLTTDQRTAIRVALNTQWGL